MHIFWLTAGSLLVRVSWRLLPDGYLNECKGLGIRGDRGDNARRAWWEGDCGRETVEEVPGRAATKGRRVQVTSFNDAFATLCSA